MRSTIAAVFGFTEETEEADTHERRHFGTKRQVKATEIDNGDPQIDEDQASDNFQHVVKKGKTTRKTALKATDVEAVVAAAAAAARRAAGRTARRPRRRPGGWGPG